MLQLLTVIFFSLSAFQVASLVVNNTFASFRIESLPNPLVIEWANEEYTCTRSPTWLSDTFDPTDCALAVTRFHDIEVVPRGETVYEYIQAGGQQKHAAYYGQATPRQYTFGRRNGVAI